MNISTTSDVSTASQSTSTVARLARQLLATSDSLGSTVARVALGAMILPHGAQKLLGWFGGYGFEGTMGFFTGTLGIPAVFAFLAIVAEFFGGIALLLGVGTRVAALGVGAVMGVASTLHWQHGFFMNWYGNQKGEGVEFFVLAIALALVALLQGGGRFSIDRALTRN
ncbi:MAG: DoxX family protein [Opitutaceae bacterium]|nr:DoxX family protein [Opitutaceae bacterium]